MARFEFEYGSMWLYNTTKLYQYIPTSAFCLSTMRKSKKQQILTTFSQQICLELWIQILFFLILLFWFMAN